MTSIIETISAKVSVLPLAQQQEVLAFVEAKLASRDAPLNGQAKTAAGSATTVQSADQPPVKSIFGLLADSKIDITLGEFKELRREAWQHFPREFPQ